MGDVGDGAKGAAFEKCDGDVKEKDGNSRIAGSDN